MKQCCTCKKLLSSTFYNKCIKHKDNLQTKCKECTKIYRKKYYWKHRDEALLNATQWQSTLSGQKSHYKASKKYKQTKRGKIQNIKDSAKRVRKMNWILMFPNPFDENTKIEYHHITDAYIVALPKDLHRVYLGKLHREKTIEIVKQIYLGE